MNKKMQFTSVGIVVTLVAIGLIYFGTSDNVDLSSSNQAMLLKFGVVALIGGLVAATIGFTIKKQ